MSREDFEVFEEIRKERQERRSKRLAAACDTGWSKHTETHWYRFINGEKLHWWPSANKWLYMGKYYRGGLPKTLRDAIDASNQEIQKNAG